MSTNRRWTPRAGAALLLALAAAGGARADAPCVDDAARLCPGIPATDGQLWACLVRNQAQLSSRCVRNVQEVQRRASELGADCGADVYRFCPSTPRGEGRLLQCLANHVGRRELSTNCEDAVVTAVEKLQEFAAACENDAAALCPGVQPGRGRVFLCLRGQSDRLSSRCKRAVNP
ncbi:MAG TPA: cysteine rich repeat-containing protein [Anaeromyxobacter sp.]|nr:cysteine rich repeat-containing protein [Anaeromyxobacter sp.]